MPGGGSPMDRLRAQLLERRIVLVRGPLDDALATQVAAELMMLDGAGRGPVELHLDSGGGPLGAALTLIDTIDLMGAPVRATCVGRAEGSAVGVFACGLHRLVTPHARIHLSEPARDGSGHAGALGQLAEQADRELRAFAARIARACDRPAEHVEAEIERGRWLDADEAVAWGLAHEVRH